MGGRGAFIAWLCGKRCNGKNISIILGLGCSKINLHFIVLKRASKPKASIRSITFYTITLWNKIFLVVTDFLI